jgi:hypothetical protein
MVLTQHFFSARKVRKNVSFVQQNGFDPANFCLAQKSKKMSVLYNKMVFTQQIFV